MRVFLGSKRRRMTMLRRLFSKCLLRPGDISPSRDDLMVAGVFNPGAAEVNGRVALLLRVAEWPKKSREAFVALPRYTASGVEVDWVQEDLVEFLDPRVVRYKATGIVRLTFVSHLLVAWSNDGRSVTEIDYTTRFFPEAEEEGFGVEDPRITRIGDTWYFTYVAVSDHGAATALASTNDFKSFHRHGIIFPCENKDVLLFPEKINDDYVAFHRPNPATPFNPPEMWLAYSKNLLDWGRHRPFHGGSGGDWDMGRVGGGIPPIKTERGWLEIYHGNNKTPDQQGVGTYTAGAVLTALDDPSKVIARTRAPFMVPEEDFEKSGFVADVVFPTGVVEREDIYQIYYGAADANTGVVEYSKKELLKLLVKVFQNTSSY
jgi:predicted GH43/DUF377 family glycosyl hydrolase